MEVNIKRMWMLIIATLMCLSAHAQQGNASMSHYKLGVGDKISIKVFGEPALTLETRLPDVGTVNYPFLGDIKLVGLTVSEVESLIFKGLEGDYLVNPSVAVAVTEYRPFFIDGEVKDPGGYAYQPGLTVNKAVALAGGYTSRASKEDIQIIRENGGQQNTLEVDVSSSIQPGDIITIPQRFF